MEILRALIDSLKTIIEFAVTMLGNLVQLLIDIPSFISEGIEASGAVFSIFHAFFMAIPDGVFLALYISMLGIFLSRLLFGRSDK